MSTAALDNILALVKADPLTFRELVVNKTCTIRYPGPRNAILTWDKDCVYAINVRSDGRHDLAMSPDHSCISSDHLHEDVKFFTLEQSVPTHKHHVADCEEYGRKKLHILRRDPNRDRQKVTGLPNEVLYYLR